MHNPMTQISTFIFDLDGTLVDSVPDLAVALNKTLVEFSLPPHAEPVIRNWVGNGARVLVERGLRAGMNTPKEEDIDNALVRFLHHYREAVCVHSALYKGVENTLRTLHNQGFNLALVTNKPFEFIASILETFSLTSLFCITLGGDSQKEKKPSPMPLLHVCNELGVGVNQCIMVGDSKNDILAAKAANMKSIGLTYGYNYGQDISQYNPDWVFNSFEEILSLQVAAISCN